MNYGSPTPATPRGYEKLSVSSASVALAVDYTTRINFCLVKTSANVRIRDDGTAPTATDGFPISANETFYYNGDPRKLRFIRESSDATVHVLYYEA